MTKTALITGGAGFIGSHLADKLLDQGWQVISFDNLLVGRLKNIAQVRGHPRFTLILGDVADREALMRIVKEFAVEVIFHLAAIHYIPYCNERPFEAIRINVLGTQAVVDAAIAAGVRKIVFTSTADVYVVKDEPHIEADPLKPFTVYGTSKLFSERLLALAASLQRSLSVTVARLFNVYGPRETNPHILPEILAQLRDGDKRTLRLGNLWPKRDFIYVNDVTSALVAMLQAHEPFEVFNVGSGRALSVREVIQVLSELIGREFRIETDPARVRPVERAYVEANIEMAHRMLDWKPVWRFEDGLRQWLDVEHLD